MSSTGAKAKKFTKTQDLFLGIAEKKYVRSISGAFHGIGSLFALILANIIFATRSTVSDPMPWHLESIELLCHGFNCVSALITMLFFWDKVQNWQLSTTSMKEKGLTPLILMRFNQGRGVVTMLLCSAFPLLQSTLPKSLLDDPMFSAMIAFLFIGSAIWVYDLVKDYSKPVYIAYGVTPLAVGVSVLLSGSVSALHQSYPLMSAYLRREVAFTVSCVQMGFMLYYMYSRGLVTKSTVQKICKSYHVSLLLVQFARIQYDCWWSILPWPMAIQPALLTILVAGLIGSKSYRVAAKQMSVMKAMKSIGGTKRRRSSRIGSMASLS